MSLQHETTACPPISPSCPPEHRRTDPSGCCTVCLQCTDSAGTVHNIGDTWRVDDCTRCTCTGDSFYKQSLISTGATLYKKVSDFPIPRRDVINIPIGDGIIANLFFYILWRPEKVIVKNIAMGKIRPNSEKLFAVLPTFGIVRKVFTIFHACTYFNISENADTVCQVHVCEARTCDLGFEVVTVTNALPTGDNDTCCPKTVCVPLTALQSTAFPLTLRPPTSQPMRTWPPTGGPPNSQPMTARPPCPPLMEPTCGEHQVSRLVTGSSAAQHPCPRLVCGTRLSYLLCGTFLH